MNIETLEKNLGRLSEKDRGFAVSLMKSVRTQKRSPSDKQVYWINELARRAENGETAAPERQKTAVGDLSGVMVLFDRARKHLKHPAIVLGWRNENEWINEVRLNLAGDTARVPGSINVINEGDRNWFGRILKDGQFEHSPRTTTPKPVLDLLGRFACDPVAVAGEHGRLTGKCCFCNTALTDERSTGVGYGPVCAKRFGLDWGKAAAAKVAAEADLIHPDELEMRRLEAEADRAGTERDEANKWAARQEMEAA
jgi:hypothetical protein